MARNHRANLISKAVESGKGLRKRYAHRQKTFSGDELKRELEKLGMTAPEGASRLYKFTISDDSRDRHGDTIEVDGWQTETFNKSGSVLFAHDQESPPVMKSLHVETEDGALKSWAVDFEKGLYDFADMIADMVAKDYLRMTSVGFVPLEFEPKDGQEDEWFPDLNFTKQDLTEYSIVPSGSNRNAFIEGVSEEFEDTLQEYTEQVLDGEKDVPEEAEEELEEAYSETKEEVIMSISEDVIEAVREES